MDVAQNLFLDPNQCYPIITNIIKHLFDLHTKDSNTSEKGAVVISDEFLNKIAFEAAAPDTLELKALSDIYNAHIIIYSRGAEQHMNETSTNELYFTRNTTTNKLEMCPMYNQHFNINANVGWLRELNRQRPAIIAALLHKNIGKIRTTSLIWFAGSAFDNTQSPTSPDETNSDVDIAAPPLLHPDPN